MKLSNDSTIPVYTIAGSSSARPLPEWLARKRKRSLKTDPDYMNRVELLQDFEFEEASSCVRVSEDGEWVMSTGTYKPQMHVHYLPHLALSYARHTNALNQTFVLLGSDYGKSLHLQTDRSLEFHVPSGLHYTTRIPRYGRDLKYNKRTAEALIPSVGVNSDGHGEVFRLNLEIGRFMKGFEVEVGGDDFESLGGGALQGGIRAGAVNCAAVAEDSHGLLAFGTSLGTVEFWDSRSRNRVSALGPSTSVLESGESAKPELTALTFHDSGLQLASGDSNGMIYTYDLRSPIPLLRQDQGYGSRIQNLKYLTSSSRSSSISSDKLLSADRRCIKIWDTNTGDYWTSVEPAVELNHVEWVPDSGMILTANEGRQQHAFFIPQLGPAPRWCGFLDNIVEEMAEDADDPSAFKSRSTAGEVYANYKFVDMKQLRELHLDHLVGQTNLLRPYMHGYFVAQNLYEQARLLTNPDIAQQQRQKTIQEKIDKERESRIRGNKKIAVKVNRKLAEKLAARDEANERRKADRVLRQGGDEPSEPIHAVEAEEKKSRKATTDLMADDRFKRLFEDDDFEIDETSREFQMHNPSTAAAAAAKAPIEAKKRGLTAVEEEALTEHRGSSDEDDSDHDSEHGDEAAEAAALRARARPRNHDDDTRSSKGRIGSASYRKSGHKPQSQRDGAGPRMQVSSSKNEFNKRHQRQTKSFGDLASSLPTRSVAGGRNFDRGGAVGEKEITFAPSRPSKQHRAGQDGADSNDVGRRVSRGKERRSASGNAFRRM